MMSPFAVMGRLHNFPLIEKIIVTVKDNENNTFKPNYLGI